MSQPAFGYAGDAVYVSEELIGVDQYGNDVRQDVSTTISGCVWWPTVSTEPDVTTQDTVTTGVTLLLPPHVGAAPASTDTFVLDGLEYAVVGDSFPWLKSPFTSSRAGTEVQLRRVTG